MVTNPTQCRTIFSRRNVGVMILLSWMVPCLILLPSLLEWWGRFGYVAMLVTCNLMLGKNSQSFKLVLLSARALVPCVLVGYCYIIIFRLTQHTHLKMNQALSNRVSYARHARASERRLSLTIAVILLVFGLSYFPCAVTSIIDWSTVLSKNYHMFCEITVYIASAINPLIYGLLNSQFREAFQYLLCLRCLQQQRDEPTTTRRLSLKQIVEHCQGRQHQGNMEKTPLTRNPESLSTSDQFWRASTSDSSSSQANVRNSEVPGASVFSDKLINTITRTDTEILMTLVDDVPNENTPM